ncbi:MAG: hypothetical protein RR415_13335, partial [Ruthenibacterium sp.]
FYAHNAARALRCAFAYGGLYRRIPPDSFRGKQRAAEAAEDKMIAKQIIETVDESIKGFLSDNPNKADDVKKFVAKYVKGGNYFAITESVLASKLLSDLRDTFKIKE